MAYLLYSEKNFQWVRGLQEGIVVNSDGAHVENNIPRDHTSLQIKIAGC